MAARASTSARRGSTRPAGGQRTKTDLLNGVLVVKLQDGSLRYRASIPAGCRGKRGWTPTVDTPEQAIELRRRIVEQLDDLPPMTVSFEQAMENVRADYRQRCRPATLQWFDYQVPPLRKFFGSMMVTAVKPRDIERFAAQQIASGISAGTVHHRRRALRAVLSHARDQLIHGDPLAKVRRNTWPKVRKAAVTAPEPAAIREFLAKTLASGSPRAEQDHDLVAALFLTGLRRAELARLRVEDLRPAELRLFVHGKTRDEWLPVNAEAMAVLQRMASRVGGEGHLVPGGVEEIRRVLKTRSSRNGIQLSPHALRRAFVTALIRAGHDIATVKRYSRHSTDEIQRYMAANEDDRRVLASVTLLGGS